MSRNPHLTTGGSSLPSPTSQDYPRLLNCMPWTTPPMATVFPQPFASRKPFKSGDTRHARTQLRGGTTASAKNLGSFHEVTISGDIILDGTARQFDPTLPNRVDIADPPVSA